ncbi:odorant receptor 13a isoform X2 [Cloeon dipterum]|uniref:odorant receptor 13a isoform X2 n=1 Tax=Cloeon dipterum TaxID=197152 RepID=UPI0032207C4D
MNFSLNFAKGWGHSTYILRALGFWQFDYNRSKIWKTVVQNAMCIFSIMTMTCVSALNALELILGTMPVSTFLFNMILFVRITSVLFAALAFKLKSHKIEKLLALFTDVSAPRQVEHLVQRMIQSVHIPSRRIYLFYLVLLLSVLPNVLISPYAAHYFAAEDDIPKYKLPARLWHPFDFDKYPFMYGIVYFFQVSFGIPAMLLLLGLNVLYLGFASTACHLMDHLCATLKELHRPRWIRCGAFRVGAKKTNENYQTAVERALNYAVQHHQRTIMFVDLTNEIFSQLMLADMSAIALAVGAMALQIINPDVSWERFSSALQILIFELAYFCVVCYLSSDLISKSGKQLQSSCYGSAALNWSSSNQRTARIIRLRADASALQLRAGPFHTLSLSTFRAVFGISVTFFSFLYQVQKWKS